MAAPRGFSLRDLQRKRDQERRDRRLGGAPTRTEERAQRRRQQRVERQRRDLEADIARLQGQITRFERRRETSYTRAAIRGLRARLDRAIRKLGATR